MTRDQSWNQLRSFKRGEVFFVDLPTEPNIPPDPSRVMNGKHRCVVLFDSDFPRKTVTILPITSLYNQNGDKKRVIRSDVELHVSQYDNDVKPYKGTISKDSLIRAEQIRTVSRHLLESKVGELRPDDMLELDFALISALKLQNTISKIVEYEVDKRIARMEQTAKNKKNTLER